MKTILVDAINAFVSKEGVIFEEMHKMLEEYPNPKILLTGANEEQIERFGLKNMPYQLFTLSHNPEKTDPDYYVKLLEQFGLSAEGVILFEHKPEAVKSAESIGIKTYYYDNDVKDRVALKTFIDENI